MLLVLKIKKLLENNLERKHLVSHVGAYLFIFARLQESDTDQFLSPRSITFEWPLFETLTWFCATMPLLN